MDNIYLNSNDFQKKVLKKYVIGLPWPFIKKNINSLRLALYVSHTPTREKDHAMTLNLPFCSLVLAW